MNSPKTVEEWAVYVASLPEEDLFAKAKAANAMKFFSLLQSDGLATLDIKKIMMMFALRMRDAQIAPPGGGIYDLRDMLDDPQLDKIRLPAPDPDFMEPDDEVDQLANEVPG